jgi:phosphopantothenoylcysteine decarboxylase/phosphopantothenate--cysteine ligase
MKNSRSKSAKKNDSENLKNRRILLGVTGSIAAYKALEIVRLLKGLGADVVVVMTPSALHFVGPLSFETLSENEVVKDLFPTDRKVGTRHIDLASSADVLLIAPATANIIGKIASGIGDCILSTIAYAVKTPILFAPAMNERLWENPIVQKNCRKLEGLGHEFVGPESGDLACGESGRGRMSEPAKVVEHVVKSFTKKHDLAGRRILVTAGATREYIDPVRFISNGSSGKMGFALARAAASRGAITHLISGFTSVEKPGGLKYEFAKTADDMKRAVLSALPRAHAVIMAAAVSDYRPERTRRDKVKRKNLTVRLGRCPDILMEISKSRKKTTFVVGFSLEAKESAERARLKLKAKNLDMIVSNTPESIGSDSSRAVLLTRKGDVEILPSLSKSELADRILDRVKEALS